LNVNLANIFQMWHFGVKQSAASNYNITCKNAIHFLVNCN